MSSFAPTDDAAATAAASAASAAAAAAGPSSSSFLEFARDMVDRRVSFHLGAENADALHPAAPHPVSFQTSLRRMAPRARMVVDEHRNGSARKTDRLSRLHEEKVACLKREQLRCAELFAVRRAALDSSLTRLNNWKQSSTTGGGGGRREPAATAATTTTGLTALVADVATRRAYSFFASSRLDRLRLVWGKTDDGWTWKTLAVVSSSSSSSFFLPRKLSLEGAGSFWCTDPRSYQKGDCFGRLSNDEARGAVLDESRPSEIPTDMVLSKDRFVVPQWLASFLEFFHSTALQNSALFDHRHVAFRGIAAIDDSSSTPSSSSTTTTRQMVTALVASRQVTLFSSEDSKRGVGSLNTIDECGARFVRQFETGVASAAVEKFQDAFSSCDWTSLLTEALAKSLPVARWREEEEEDVEDDDDDDVATARECLLTGRTVDLVKVTFPRCPLLDWRADASSADRAPFAEHRRVFSRRFVDRQADWVEALFGEEAAPAPAPSSSSTSSTSSSSFSPPAKRGRRRRPRSPSRPQRLLRRHHHHHLCGRDENDDRDGFLLSPWGDSTFLNRRVAKRLVHCWRVLHFDLFVDATLLVLHDAPGRRALPLKPRSVRDPVDYVVDRLMESLQACLGDDSER